jgi:hypothetical protein
LRKYNGEAAHVRPLVYYPPKVTGAPHINGLKRVPQLPL